MIINNKEINSKLYRLKNIYDMLDSITKTKKPERFNSAVNFQNKIKFSENSPYKRIKIKKLNVIKKDNKDIKEKLKANYIFDIVKRKNFKERPILKNNFKNNKNNSNAINEQNSGRKNVIIQTDRINEYKPRIKKSIFSSEQFLNKPCKNMLEYRIKKLRLKQRNNQDEIKNSNSCIYNTFKNVSLPKIYNPIHSNQERQIDNYFEVSNCSNNIRKRNMKRYFCILNNLRIKLHGNIFITRMSKELEKNNFKSKIKVSNYKNNFNINSNNSINFTNRRRYRNINRYDNCSFSNQLIKDSLSDIHMKQIIDNINK
jgi:hypothetical protein